MSKILGWLPDTHMAFSHHGLRDIAKKKLKIDLLDLKQGEYVIFINSSWSAFKMFGPGNTFFYKRHPDNKRLNPKAIMLTPAFADEPAEHMYPKALKAVITKDFKSTFGDIMKSLASDAAPLIKPLESGFSQLAGFVKAIGHFSLNAHNDTWWQEIGARLHRLVRIDVDVLHNRYDLTGLNDDDTYRQKLREHQTTNFYATDATAARDEDGKVISKLLASQRDARLRGQEWQWTSDVSVSAD